MLWNFGRGVFIRNLPIAQPTPDIKPLRNLSHQSAPHHFQPPTPAQKTPYVHFAYLAFPSPRNKKPANLLKDNGFLKVGAPRFELRTSCSRSKRATKLRYAPIWDAVGVMSNGGAL